MLGLAVVVVGRLMPDLAVMRAGLWILMVSGLIAIPAALSGELVAGVEQVGRDVSSTAFPSAMMAGVVSAWTLFQARRGRKVTAIVVVVITTIALGTAGSLVWAASDHIKSSADPLLHDPPRLPGLRGGHGR